MPISIYNLESNAAVISALALQSLLLIDPSESMEHFDQNILLPVPQLVRFVRKSVLIHGLCFGQRRNAL